MTLRRAAARFVSPVAILLLSTQPLLADTWQQVGGDSGGTRYSDAKLIDRTNVQELQEVWRFSSDDAEHWRQDKPDWKFQATPILVGARLVFCTPTNDVIALHPGTGELIWRYRDPVSLQEPSGNGRACRGVTQWTDHTDKVIDTKALCTTRIFANTNDLGLIALDALTGKPCPRFGKNGRVPVHDHLALAFPGELQVTSPPVTAQGVVLVGSAIADNMRSNAPPGTVRAFDARTGASLWSFTPLAERCTTHKCTAASSPETRSGANVWSLMSADQNAGVFYLPTSSPAVDHYGGNRPGDNRHANSTIALDALTGELKWAFQTVHHDLWDYDVAAQPTLIDLRQEDHVVPLVIQPTKTGLVFSLHRGSGKPFHAVEERRVPAGDIPGEWYSPTQPFPVRPPQLVPERIDAENVWGISPLDRYSCRQQLRQMRNEGIYTPPSTQGSVLYPFISGGVNWGSAAFAPETQTLFVLTNNATGYVKLIPRESRPARSLLQVFSDGLANQTGSPYLLERGLLASPLGAPCNPPPWGQIHAIDIADGQILWEKPLGTLKDFVPLGDRWLPHGSGNMGGPIVTAGGLIFVAAAMDDVLRALDTTSGEELWKHRLPAGGQATPMTYTFEGRQFVIIAAGGHSILGTTPGDWVVAFALPEFP